MIAPKQFHRRDAEYAEKTLNGFSLRTLRLCGDKRPRFSKPVYPVLLLAITLTACGGKSASLTPTWTVAAPPAASATPIPLAARVDGEGITLAEVEAGLTQLQAVQTKMEAALSPDELRHRVLDSLIDETLLAQGAQQAGFDLSEGDLQTRLDDLANRLGGPGQLESWWPRMGYTEELFLHALRRSVAAAGQRDRIAAAVPDRLEQVRLRQLLFLDRPSAEEALRQMKSGETAFDTLAYGLDPVTGGDLGWCPRGYLTQDAVEEAAFALQPGQLSEVIQTELGYHVLYLAAREPNRPLTLDARRALQRLAVADWLASRRAVKSVEILLSPWATPIPVTSTQVPATRTTYAVLSGDSYFSVALQFGVTVPELLAANPSLDGAALPENATLTVPGRPDQTGALVTASVTPGESLTSLARLHQIPAGDLARLNRLTSPAELYADSALVLPANQRFAAARRLPPLQPGESLLEYAAARDLNPWTLAEANQVGLASPLLPGEPVFLLAEDGGSGPLPSVIRSFTLDPLPLIQGGTTVVRVTTTEPATLTGRLDGRDLHFFEIEPNTYAAIQGIHVMAEPGLIDFSLQAETAAGLTPAFEEMLLMYSGEYENDPPLTVDPQTIDPAVTQPEMDLIASLTAAATPEKFWDGPFGFPVDVYSCSRSPFGNRRSFNDSGYIYYHGGLDYGLCDSPNIYAPAPGVVVYTGLLTVRGNATIIDHGWGVYSGIWHQSEIYVAIGDEVQAGQLIGKIGDTGRVTGAHLHWEIWSNGVQVNPLDWLARSFP